MPQIVSLLPATAAMPAATPAASAVAAAPDVLLPADPTSPNFLSQFKLALKSLANAVALPQIAGTVTVHAPTDQSAGPLLSPILDESAEAPLETKDAKHPDANVPQLLAELGFVAVPSAFSPPPTPQATSNAGPAPVTAKLARLAQPQPPQSVTPLAAQPQPIRNPIAPDETHVQVPVAPAAQLGQAAPTGNTPPALPNGLPQFAQLANAQSAQPLERLKPADLPQAVTTSSPPTVAATPAMAAAAGMLQPAPAEHLRAPVQPVTTPVPPLGDPLLAAPSGSQPGHTNGNASHDRGRHTPNKITPIAADSAPLQSAPNADGAMAAVAATVAPASGALPVQAGPSEVVSQIASHADLIRLPGNRGLHIQLHPDDLGGVQVTVRYSASGGVELHINAEHAATGALVQAGWGELRDALATHGISADRLMMSVSAPTAAGQADLSGSGGGGNRSDPNSSGFSSQASLNSETSQGSQGQARQDNPQQRAAPGWSGPLDPISSPDGTPRVASAGAAPSRIDYRV